MSPIEPKEFPAPAVTWRRARGVVLFADVCGFFDLARKSPLEELGTVIAQLYGLWGGEIRRQRGEVVSYIGDSVLARFSADSCGTMDPEWCATLAAFHIVKGMKKIRPELEITVGLNSGEMLEGCWEEAGRPMLTILGDVVNRAAMLVGGPNRPKGIHATQPVVDILGPRVAREKVTLRVPNNGEELAIWRLNSLVL